MAASTSGSILKNLADDKDYYAVDSNLYEFIEKLNGCRCLKVKEANLLSFRKYNADVTNDSRFYCCECYFKHGETKHAYFTNGILQAPRNHSCQPTPISTEKPLKEVKTEANFPSQSKSNVISFEDPLQNVRSNSVEDTVDNRPLSRESDIIFLENDEINPDNKDSTALTEKMQALKQSSAYRSVGPDEYEEAYSHGGIVGNRLIVFEEYDLCNVRQYAGNQNKFWYCLGCFRSCKKRTPAFHDDDDGTFLVPKEHDCRPITYNEAKEEQNKIIEKWKIDKKEASIADHGEENKDDAKNELNSSAVNESQHPEVQLETGPVSTRLRPRTPPPLLVPSAPRPRVNICRRRKSVNSSSASNNNEMRREIKADQYVFGFNGTNKNKGRLFVFANAADKLSGHEYSLNTGNTYYCKGCIALNKSGKRIARVNPGNGIVSIPCNHICKPILYEVFQKEQEKIKERHSNVPSSSRKKYTSRRRIINLSKTASATSAIGSNSTTSASLASKTSTSTPIYSGACLSNSKAQHSSQVRNQQLQTPPPLVNPRFFDAFQSGVERNPVIQRRKTDAASSAYNNVATPVPAKKAKTTEIEHRSRESDGSAPKEIARANVGQAQTIPSINFKPTNVYNLQLDKNGAQKTENSSTSSSSSNASTPANAFLLNRRILYSTKTSSTLPNILPPKTTLSNLLNNISSAKPSLLNSTTSIKQSIPTPIPPTPPIPSTTPDLSTTIKFITPSSDFFEMCCEKLEIKYDNHEAYKFWMNIKISKVAPESIPDKLHQTVETIYHGFECISLYITGDEEKAAVIREKINVHHYNENSESLFPIDREIEGKSIFSQTITEAHLQSLAKWFECRIGIFFEGKWTKYGNWTLAGIPTLLMERKDGKYAPILSLK